MIKMKKWLALMLALALVVSCTPQGGNTTTPAPTQDATTATPTTPPPPPEPTPIEIPHQPYSPEGSEMRDIPSMELIKEIGAGWNLGNTFDAPWGETSWTNPRTTYASIKAVADAGFDSVRVPVTWFNHIGGEPDYLISDEFLDRLEEVVGYVLSNDMYCIINTHHENWIFPDEEKADENEKQLVALWTQISERFAEYNERLIFEGMNEPRLRGTSNEWNGGTFAAREIVNELNKAFIQAVRDTGGRNSLRHLMLPSYAASAEYSAMSHLQAAFPPLDRDDKIIASIHAYTPYDFAHAAVGTSEWNADSDTGEIDLLFERLEELFLSRGIAVIIGETAALNRDNVEARAAWAKYYFGKGREHGVPVFWWDNGIFVQNEQGNRQLFGILNRYTAEFTFPQIVDAIMDK